MNKLSFVIPCYGSEKTLETVINDIINNVKPLTEYDYEIILVNDFSPDNVLNVIKKLCSENKKIKGISLSRNFGQHNAILAGIKVSCGDIVFVLDDDGQLSLEKIKLFLDKIEDGYDVVIGKFSNSSVGFFKQIGSKINAFMANILIDKPKDLEITSLYAMRRFVADEMVKYENPYTYITGLMLKSTAKIVNLPIEQHQRIAGKSGYSFKKLFSLWMNGFTAFSVKPLRISTFLGVICAIIGFIFGIYIVVNKLLNPTITAGYSSIMAVLLVIGGIILLMLGMIGEYVGRIYISINKLPQYVIREKINIEEVNREN